MPPSSDDPTVTRRDPPGALRPQFLPPRPPPEPPREHPGAAHRPPPGPASPATGRARVASPPPGTPFHQMGRTALHRWWRPFMGLLAFVAVLAGVMITGVLLVGAVMWTKTGEWVPFTSKELEVGPIVEAVARMSFTALLIPVPFLVVRLYSQRPWGSLLSVLGRIRWRWLAACTVLAAECVVLGFAMSAVLKGAFTDEPPLPPWHSWESFRRPLLESLPATVLVGVALELYRVWIMQTVGAHTLQRADGGRRRGVAGLLGKVLRTPWPAITAGAALHVPFSFSNGQEVKAGAFFFCWFCLLGWLVVKTGGVEAVLAFLVTSDALTHAFDVAAGEYPTGTDMPYLYSMGAPLLGLLFFAPFVLWLRQLMDVAVVTPPPAAYQAGGC